MPRITCGSCKKEYTATFKTSKLAPTRRVNCPDCGWRLEESAYLATQKESETAPAAAPEPELLEDDEDDD